LLPRDEESELRRDFGTWLSHLLRRLHPGAIIPETLVLEDIPMLEETLTEWLAEGRREGMRQILLQLLDQRFGTLPQQVRRQVEAGASAQRVGGVAKQGLVGDSLQAMGLR